ncbi:methylmalonyl-CoA mutase subunit beta [Maribacter sp. Asnod1-A12]|uniref:methylmalonyl-CoA mutase subunit beta n=1 Tax=Maribacter sp. Asnod1-A12 TaxID=3160576 RepID=UPI003870BF70
MNNHALFESFRVVSGKEWKQKIQYDLKGKDYNEEVVWNSPEGIKVKPFYDSEDLEHIAVKPSLINTWNIGQVVYAGNAIMSNEKALKFIEKGAEAIRFLIPDTTIDIAKILNDIDLNVVKVYLNMQFLSKQFMDNTLVNVSRSNNIHFQIDPIGYLARSGNWYDTMSADIDMVVDLASCDIENLLCVDVSLYENAGADMVQQLAYALAHANEYMNILNESGNLNKLKVIDFNVAVGGNYFFEIAKLKALRNLWSILVAEYNTFVKCHITSIPSKRNKTIYDYNVNLLRTTTESMSAILGGADSVFNQNYNVVYKKSTDFAERITINQLILLKEESYFNKVENPTEGSYYIETITNQLSEKALILFKSIEKDGGFLKQLKNHTVQNRIAESAKKQQEKFNSKNTILVGTNAYQNGEDKMSKEIELYPFLKKNPRKTLISPIIEKRLAEELEQNRLSNE